MFMYQLFLIFRIIVAKMLSCIMIYNGHQCIRNLKRYVVFTVHNIYQRCSQISVRQSRWSVIDPFLTLPHQFFRIYFTKPIYSKICKPYILFFMLKNIFFVCRYNPGLCKKISHLTLLITLQSCTEKHKVADPKRNQILTLSIANAGSKCENKIDNDGKKSIVCSGISL